MFDARALIIQLTPMNGRHCGSTTMHHHHHHPLPALKWSAEWLFGPRPIPLSVWIQPRRHHFHHPPALNASAEGASGPAHARHLRHHHPPQSFWIPPTPCSHCHHTTVTIVIPGIVFGINPVHCRNLFNLPGLTLCASALGRLRILTMVLLSSF